MAALGQRDLRLPDLERLAEGYRDQPLTDLVDRRPAGQPAAHRGVVVERADYELRRRGRTVDRHLGPVSHQQGQRPAVVEVRVRYDGRVEPIQSAEVGRYGAAPVRFDPRIDQNPRLAEVEEVAAATHLSRPSQGAEGQRRPWPGVAADPRERGARSRHVRSLL